MVEESLAAAALVPPGRRELMFDTIPVEAPPVLYEVVAVPEESSEGEVRSRYIGRVYDAYSGDRANEKPYSSTYPDSMGRWLYSETGLVPPEELGGEKAIKRLREGGKP